MMERRVRASAQVVAVSGDQMELHLATAAACGGCGAQAACDAARGKSARFPLAPGMAAGDCVTLEMSESQLNLGAVAAYLLPAACTLTGALLLAPGGDALAALGAGLGLGFGIVCLGNSTRGCTVVENTITGNTGTGLAFNGGAAYPGNTINGNGGIVSNGVQTGVNVCVGDAVCP